MNPVFLVGCPRSGTTLLQRILDAHPQIAVAPETHYVRRVWKRRRELPADGDPLDRDSRSVAQGWFTEMPEFDEMELDRASFLERTRETRCIPDLFLELLRMFGERRGASIVGEKTPNHLRSMRLLERQFPDAAFVHIVRDPRAVVDSWSRVPWTNGSPAADAEVWRKYMQAARETPPRDPSRLYSLRYEKLVTDGVAELERLCAFLNVPYDPRIMEFHRNTDPTLNLEREPWKANAASPLDARTATRWKERMSAAAIAATEAVVWSEARRLGYPLTRRGPAAWIAAGREAAVRRKRRRDKRQGKASSDPSG